MDLYHQGRGSEKLSLLSDCTYSIGVAQIRLPVPMLSKLRITRVCPAFHSHGPD